MSRKSEKAPERVFNQTKLARAEELLKDMKSFEQFLDKVEIRFSRKDVEILDNLRHYAYKLAHTAEACIEETEGDNDA